MAANEDTGPGPVVSRWRLRTAVRRLREQRQLTQDQVAQQLGWSTSKMIRIERGTSKLSVADLQALLGLFEVTDPSDVARMIDGRGAAVAATGGSATKGPSHGATPGTSDSKPTPWPCPCTKRS